MKLFNEQGELIVSKLVALIFTAILAIVLIFGCWATVSPGNRGIRVTMGKVSEETLESGFYLKWPLIQKIVEMNVRNLKLVDQTSAYTRDIQQAAFNVTLNFQLQPDHANRVYREIGIDWQNVVIPQSVRDSLKSVIGKWDAVYLIENRQKAVDEATQTIRAQLEPRGISVISFAVENIDFNDEFEKANEAKVTAVQRAIEAENHTKQVEEEAKQKVIAAKAEAESMSIRSQALARNHGLVEYEAVQKWDGKLPQYMLGNTTPFINIGKAKEKTNE